MGEIKAYRSRYVGKVLRIDIFDDWLDQQEEKIQVLVEARLERISKEGYFGWVNKFEGLTELKWKSGLRVYTYEKSKNVFVIIGGSKNGQQRDIEQAKRIIREI